MKAKLISKENNIAQFTMEFDEAALSCALQKAYFASKDRFEVDGFRKGEAPRAVIEKRYGAKVFWEPAVNELTSAAFLPAADELGLTCIEALSMDVSVPAQGGGFTATVRASLLPVVPVKNYKGVRVKRMRLAVSEPEVRQELERVRRLYAERNGLDAQAVEMNDEFAQKVSNVRTMAELTAQMREAMERRAATYGVAQTKDAVMAKIFEQNPYEPDHAMLVNEVNKKVDAMRAQLLRQGSTLEQYMAKTGQTMDVIVKGFMPEAASELRIQVLMTSIAEAEGITVSEADVENEIKAMAAQFRMDPERMKQAVGDERLHALPRDIRIRKAIDFVYDNAIIDE